MPTVEEFLGPDLEKLKAEGKTGDEILAIAKQRYKNPPQQNIIPQEVPQEKSFIYGQTGNGLIDFGADAMRKIANTAYNYANVAHTGVANIQDAIHEEFPGIVDKAQNRDYYTNLIQKIEKIDESKKDAVRTPERKKEVQSLQKEASKADGYVEKLEAGGKGLWDTFTHPNEWSAGGIVGSFVDPINGFYVGGTVLKALIAGTGINTAQTASFTAARSDKSVDDVLAESTLSAGSGAVLGTGVNLGTKVLGHGINKVSGALKKDKSGAAPESDGPSQEVKKDTETSSKVDKSGMLIDPFETGDKKARVSPQVFVDKTVEKKGFEAFTQVFADEEARVEKDNISIKSLGREMRLKGASDEEIEIAVATAFPPSPEAVTITKIINDGMEMTPRLNGRSLQKAIENSIKDPNYKKTPQEFYDMMVLHGATNEHANAAVKAYTSRDIGYYGAWAMNKLAKNRDILVDYSNIRKEAELKLSKVVGDTKDIQKVSKADINKDLEMLKTHERYNDALDFSREVDAKDGVSPQILETPKKVTTIDNPDGYKTTHEAATYSKNYSHDFFLTRAKVKRIEEGRPTPSDLEDLKADIKTLEESPNYAKEPHHIIEEGLDAEAAFANDNIPGEHGPVLHGYRGNYKAARSKLIKLQDGEAVGALYHKNIGPIDLIWGKEGSSKSDGYGLAKLERYHPEVVENLDNIIANMDIVKSNQNRIQLESKNHKIAVRLTWEDKNKTWLLTAFEKKETPIRSSTDIAKDKAEMTTPSGVSDLPESSITQESINNNDASLRYQKDIEYLSKEGEIIINGESVKYKDIEAEYEHEASIIKKMEDCF